MKASYIGDRIAIARALEYMGYARYLRRGDYHNAYGAYEAAAEKYIDTVYADTDHDGEWCKDSMARIKQKQENTDTVIGFHRHNLDIDCTLFYPPCSGVCKCFRVLNSASYYPTLCILVAYFYDSLCQYWIL